ncbi:hypothetical protein NMYAN_80017 [Nitrosomonas nitrosa]|uniref:Uncharacterized protein n=1 Tax=Nitrosomonas nitrosa TaxID=52442 RepID=A0A8H9DCH7_9PROT|nr:hypothetical protein NMYAN_80017 [Nitrosomonas nitrosa]
MPAGGKASDALDEIDRRSNDYAGPDELNSFYLRQFTQTGVDWIEHYRAVGD